MFNDRSMITVANYSTPVGLSRVFSRSWFGIVALLSLAPMDGQADCLPSIAVGWDVPVTMTTVSPRRLDQSGNPLVSYTRGTLRRSNNSNGFYLSTYDLVPNLVVIDSALVAAQLFSDRAGPGEACLTSSVFCSQPFDFHRPDSLSLEVFEPALYYVVPGSQTNTPPITVTLTLDSWGKGKIRFQGYCDASTNVLYGSFNNDTFASISFGTPRLPK